ncbi:hypothetical protein NDU88_003433 [Pleurodeles waltl]|uniref:Uncharacterized protein n=1 Tax=Pleurodeles waltl TaxID=8319 RepID=A0AAV7W5Z9_PLEWA|nr:hypothetical protein NDU88_003433 [Pleurodeles waltl]
MKTIGTGSYDADMRARGAVRSTHPAQGRRIRASAASSGLSVLPLMVPVCPGAHLCAPPAPNLVVDTGLPLNQGPLAPHVFSTARDPITKSRSGPWLPASARSQLTSDSMSARNTRSAEERSPAHRHHLYPGGAAPASLAPPVSLTAGCVPARESPASRGRSGRRLSGSPTPSGTTRQSPEQDPQFSCALYGTPALQLRDAPGLISVS